MGKQIKKPRKHIPQRTCVGCREVEGKKTMIRVVRTEEGVFLDNTGKMAGRGAYLHLQKDCIQKGLNGAIARALKSEIHASHLDQLRDSLQIELDRYQEQFAEENTKSIN
jgi:predicted RNA-binding protein YlxR (DUF448 family)